MIFSDSEFEEIHYHLQNEASNNFIYYLLREVDSHDDGILKSRDELIINYFTNDVGKDYINRMPDHIKNKILANSL